MALTDDEIKRIRAELSDNVVDLGALPLIGHRSIYEVLKANVSASAVAATTSATAVATAGPTTLTLASVAGLAAGDKLVLDVDASRETVTLRAISGSTVSVICRKTHSGTYPVEIESALTLVRGALADLAMLSDQINEASGGAGIKSVDEVVYKDGLSTIQELRDERHARRIDLARMLGLGWVFDGGRVVEVY